jgi:hypothetical protein|tara:strand:- start:95 stop:424 length:330 start_codon:yes stop_codon:yes gene_type:complete
MNKKDIPENTVIMTTKISSDGHMDIAIGHNITLDEFDDETLEFIESFIDGLNVQLDSGMDTLLTMGRMSRMIRDLTEEQSEVEFEPDEELLDAIHEAKVISLSTKKRLN